METEFDLIQWLNSIDQSSNSFGGRVEFDATEVITRVREKPPRALNQATVTSVRMSSKGYEDPHKGKKRKNLDQIEATDGPDSIHLLTFLVVVSVVSAMNSKMHSYWIIYRYLLCLIICDEHCTLGLVGNNLNLMNII